MSLLRHWKLVWVVSRQWLHNVLVGRNWQQMIGRRNVVYFHAYISNLEKIEKEFVSRLTAAACDITSLFPLLASAFLTLPTSLPCVCVCLFVLWHARNVNYPSHAVVYARTTLSRILLLHFHVVIPCQLRCIHPLISSLSLFCITYRDSRPWCNDRICTLVISAYVTT